MSRTKSSEIIGELKRIANENRSGMLVPEEVVEAAKPEDSVLHGQFEWNDGKAAEQYRIQQARQLINVCYELVGSGSEMREARVFVSLREDRDRGGYRPMVTVLSSAELRKKLLDDAFVEMEQFKQKYRDLKELVAVFSAMSTTLRRRRKTPESQRPEA